MRSREVCGALLPLVYVASGVARKWHASCYILDRRHDMDTTTLETILTAASTEAQARATRLCAACRPHLTPGKAAMLKSLQIKAFSDTDSDAFEASLFRALPADFECSEDDEAAIVKTYTAAGVACVNAIFAKWGY